MCRQVPVPAAIQATDKKEAQEGGQGGIEKGLGQAEPEECLGWGWRRDKRAGRTSWKRGPAGGAWKMRGFCAAFPQRTLSSLPPHSLPRAHIFPEKCFNPTPLGTWAPSPTPSLPQCLQIWEPQTWSSHCSPAWPALSPKKGNLQLLSGACWQLQGPSVSHLLSVPLPLWVPPQACFPLMWLDPLHPYPGVAWGLLWAQHATPPPQLCGLDLLCLAPPQYCWAREGSIC